MRCRRHNWHGDSADNAEPDVTPIGHFHDTRASGLVNHADAPEAGVPHFDCAFGGVGGHSAKVRYGGGHTGNVATEDWVNLLESMGVKTGIDLGRLPAVSAECEAALGRDLHARVTRSGLNPLLAVVAAERNQWPKANSIWPAGPTTCH
ncbi:hypothetical protein P3W85_18765 [Cupriavidus basilensis]|uniref:Pyruvate carboxyltransferase domain-containing protein n=1 Tax=Cupriavidus basilensis TaxID=68895 RepID=A0ABT6ARB6_9BURK|nr:hypothetical protein [Cupriavidus basilensis]MDF3834984.1 hypothetical protein [Cupriavidus basilensis]